MPNVFNFQSNQPTVWYHKVPVKSNKHCLYCGRIVGENSELKSNKEHLIGRNFVPKGKFKTGQEFNFIFRGCKICNRQKGKLERHISSITIFNSPSRLKDSKVNKIALRKGNQDYHPDKSGTKIKNSSEGLDLKFNKFLKFSALGPPQLNPSYVKRLSVYHIKGLFSLITSNNPLETEGTKIIPSEQILFFNFFNQRDWGNKQLQEVTSRVKNWPCPARIITADSFFKAIFKISEDHENWFWALEWNKYLRIIGGINATGNTPSIFKNLPSLNWKYVVNINGEKFRYRKETALNHEDELFKLE